MPPWPGTYLPILAIAQILFFGAEFTQVYANRFGSHIRPKPNAQPVGEDKRANQGMDASPDRGGAKPGGKPGATGDGSDA